MENNKNIISEQESAVIENDTCASSLPSSTITRTIGKTTYIVRVHFSQTAKETMEDKIKRLLREEVRKM